MSTSVFANLGDTVIDGQRVWIPGNKDDFKYDDGLGDCFQAPLKDIKNSMGINVLSHSMYLWCGKKPTIIETSGATSTYYLSDQVTRISNKVIRPGHLVSVHKNLTFVTRGNYLVVKTIA